MGWMIGVRWFHSRRALGIFLFTTATILALQPTQPLIQWVPGALSLVVKCLGHEADHSSPFSAKVKNEWLYTSTHQFVFMA
jgi:fatty acid desaturase